MSSQIDSARSHPAVAAALVVGGIAFTAGGGQVLVPSYATGELSVINPTTYAVVVRRLNDLLGAVYVCNEDGTVSIITN